MEKCFYVSKSSPYVRLEVESVASSSAPLTSITLAPNNIVITQACIVMTPEVGCPDTYLK